MTVIRAYIITTETSECVCLNKSAYWPASYSLHGQRYTFDTRCLFHTLQRDVVGLVLLSRAADFLCDESMKLGSLKYVISIMQAQSTCLVISLSQHAS